MILVPWIVWASACDSSAARLRIVHASIDAALLDVSLHNTSAEAIAQFPRLAYASATPYQKIPDDGDYTIELRTAGSAADGEPLVTSDPFHLSNGENATAVIVGLAGTADSALGLQVLVEEERFDLPAPTDNAWVRVVNAVSDVPTLALTATSGDGTSNETGDLDRFGTVSVPALRGQPVGVSASPMSTSFTLTLPSTGHVFLIATGLSTAPPGEDAGFELLQVGTDGSSTIVRQDPIVYALAASPDAPLLDLFDSDAEVASGLGFGQLSPIQLSPGDHDLDIFTHSPTNARPAGEPSTSVKLTGLEAGKRYLAVASGYASSTRTPSFQTAVYEAGFAAAETSALLRVVQAAPDLPVVDLVSIDGGVVAPIADFRNLSLLGSSPAAGTVVPTTFACGIVSAGTDVVTASFEPIPTQSSTRSFAVLAGAAMPVGEDQPLQLLLIDTTSEPWSATSVATQ